MQSLKFRTQAACRIAGIDRDRFNEAVARGDYACAPEVVRGATRHFEEVDLISLFVYGRLLRRGHSPRVAGQYACAVHGVLDISPDEKEVMIIFSSEGASKVLAGNEIEETPRNINKKLPVFDRISFDIENIRGLVRREMEDEASTIGGDDEP